jgi:hypothetical protein
MLKQRTSNKTRIKRRKETNGSKRANTELQKFSPASVDDNYIRGTAHAENVQSRKTEDTYPYEDRTIANPDTKLDSLQPPAQPSQPAMEIRHGSCIFALRKFL